MEPQDWRVRVDMAVARALADKKPSYGAPGITARFRGGAGQLIREAAKARGITISAFIRRSTLAMAAQVLEIDYDQAVAYDPRFQWLGEGVVEDDTGRLAGPWEIVGLR